MSALKDVDWKYLALRKDANVMDEDRKCVSDIGTITLKQAIDEVCTKSYRVATMFDVLERPCVLPRSDLSTVKSDTERMVADLSGVSERLSDLLTTVLAHLKLLGLDK
jgi:hypothetical protein